MLESRSLALPKDQTLTYRSSVMRAAYLAEDRPDRDHAVKTLERKMVAPTDASLTDLKRLGRYLKKHHDFAQVFPKKAVPKCVKVQVDADHAGDAVARQSTTGMFAFCGRHCVKHASNERRCAGLGLESLLAGFGIEVRFLVKGDSSAAKGTVNRVGLGKARHIQTRCLWLQERVSANQLKIQRVPGKQMS